MSSISSNICTVYLSVSFIAFRRSAGVPETLVSALMISKQDMHIMDETSMKIPLMLRVEMSDCNGQPSRFRGSLPQDVRQQQHPQQVQQQKHKPQKGKITIENIPRATQNTNRHHISSCFFSINKAYSSDLFVIWFSAIKLFQFQSAKLSRKAFVKSMNGIIPSNS